jgi:hypothetical protein
MGDQLGTTVSPRLTLTPLNCHQNQLSSESVGLITTDLARPTTPPLKNPCRGWADGKSKYSDLCLRQYQEEHSMPCCKTCRKKEKNHQPSFPSATSFHVRLCCDERHRSIAKSWVFVASVQNLYYHTQRRVFQVGQVGFVVALSQYSLVKEKEQRCSLVLKNVSI